MVREDTEAPEAGGDTELLVNQRCQLHHRPVAEIDEAVVAEKEEKDAAPRGDDDEEEGLGTVSLNLDEETDGCIVEGIIRQQEWIKNKDG